MARATRAAPIRAADQPVQARQKTMQRARPEARALDHVAEGRDVARVTLCQLLELLAHVGRRERGVLPDDVNRRDALGVRSRERRRVLIERIDQGAGRLRGPHVDRHVLPRGYDETVRVVNDLDLSRLAGAGRAPLAVVRGLRRLRRRGVRWQACTAGGRRQGHDCTIRERHGRGDDVRRRPLLEPSRHARSSRPRWRAPTAHRRGHDRTHACLRDPGARGRTSRGVP